MTAETPSPELLARYLAGSARGAERAAVAAWAADPANRRELERLTAAWRSSPASQAWEVDRAWQRVAGQLDTAADRGRALPFRSRAPLLAAAAAVLLMLGAGWLWTVMRTGPLPPAIHLTQAGEQREVTLPDGSRIVLAPRSELRVAAGFGEPIRRVDLRGEAWFEVEHDAARPFLVHAAGTITEDLGTEFLVRELPGGTGVEVALVSGSASLRHEGEGAADAVTLAPRDLARLSRGDRRAQVTHQAALDTVVSWRSGFLTFDDAPLDVVRAALERWHGLVVVLADPALGARRFSGSLPLGSAADALEVLRIALGVTMDRQGTTVVVR